LEYNSKLNPIVEFYMSRENQSFQDFASAILDDGVIDADEVVAIKERLYEDGVIDRSEANFLFKLNDAVSGKANHESWKSFFIEAITDYVLEDDETPGEIDADEANYLIEKIKGDGQVDEIELALLVNICDKAKGESPETLSTFVLSSIKSAILEDGVVDLDEVQMLRKVIYGTGGAGGAEVDRAEANLLFEINDVTTGNENASEWKNFFVEALSKHLLEDEVSPNEIDDEEGDWLVSKIEGDGQLDDNEKSLLLAIKGKATCISEKLNNLMQATF
jgi:hypothetical protein